MTDPDRAPSRTARHRDMLLLSMLAIALSFALRVEPDGDHVSVRGLPGLPLPQSCLSRTVFHQSCPGCGLTRSFVYLASGDVAASLRAHRIGWLLALATLAQLPYRWFCLRHPDRRAMSPLITRGVPVALIALLIGNWVVAQAADAWRTGRYAALTLSLLAAAAMATALIALPRLRRRARQEPTA